MKGKMWKIAYLGLFLALSLILSYVESMIPVVISVPGIKLGLANCAILILFYLYSPKEAAIINATRILLSALMFSGLYALMYSAAGAVLSFLIMLLLYKKEKVFSPIGVGMMGGVFHNLGQILIAFAVTRVKGLLYYLPFLVLSGLITGALVGFLCKILLPGLTKALKNTNNNRT